MQTTISKTSVKATKSTQTSRLKIIRTTEDHQRALARMLKLMKLDPPLGSAESDEMDVLGLLIEQYEEKHFPMDRPDPVEVIKFMMDQQNLKKKDLIPYIGSAPKVTEVLNGKRSLSLSMIRKLSEGLKIPASVLIREPVRKRA